MTREEIIAANPIADFVRSRGHELKPAGENFVTSGCPVKQHKKYHRPNTVDPAKNLWHCNDCGGGGTVIDWLSKEKRISVADALRELGGGGEIVCAYDYTDERGKLLFQVCRFDPKDFRQRRPDGNGGFVWNLKGVRRVLYRLPEVLATKTVVVVEGEKDADNLAALGFTATTNCGGAKKWRDEYNEFLRGKDVVVFGDVGDSDRAGEKHTEQVIASLLSSGIATRHALQPDGFHDVSDYIASLPHETARDTIQKLIDETELVGLRPLADGEPVELPPLPPPYVPPPLDLLPGVLQDYVHEAAESLNVDVSFILLPLLSALGSAIGNTRSIFLKRGFVQPPVIWTNIVGRSGSRKSPALEKATFAVMEHERELARQSKQAMEIYENDRAEWESKSKRERGEKPEPPAWQSCMGDDLTLAVLAEALELNPRGLLVRRDELSGWYSSFDQFTNAKGSDVSRWLSLHTGESFLFDRRSDKRHYRLWQPRVSITGGIQPRVLQRVLTEDFFDRGLPARFLFAHPPMRQDKWSEAEVSDASRARVLELFRELWLLQPESDVHGQPRPKLLRLDSHAQAEYVRYYDECGASAVEADEHEEAAWSKLSGYAARFALVGQLLRDPHAETATGATMQAACNLARWSGAEAVRIYASLVETQEQREQRELIEFIERRRGDVTVRDLTHYCWAYKGQTEKAARDLVALVKMGLGEWQEKRPEGRGRPTRIFHRTMTSPSPKKDDIRGETGNYGDGDAESVQKIRPSGEPDTEAETLAADESGVVRL